MNNSTTASYQSAAQIARLVKADNLAVDEALLTGESKPTGKRLEVIVGEVRWPWGNCCTVSMPGAKTGSVSIAACPEHPFYGEPLR